MKKLLLTLMACLLTLGLWADTSLTETFSMIGNLNNGTSDIYGNLCTWHRTLASHRAQDTIAVKTRRAFLLPVAQAGKGKLETIDWEGGIKTVEFKFGRFGSENTNGRVLQLNVKAGTIENPTATYAKNAMKQSTGGNTTYETYSYAFNCKEQDAQLIIDNISTHTETLTENSSICRILVADIVVTPYLLYRNKEVTIGSKQKGYVNQDLINNTESGTITYSSDAPGVATVDPSTGVVTPVSAGDAVITAAWSEGVATTYTLHVVDGIIVENFSKVLTERPDAASQEGSAVTWSGDLFDWTVRNVRRGVDDTIGLSPRKQATAMRLKDGANTYMETPNVIEGGVKHVQFNYRQWASASGTLTLSINYGKTNGSWDTPAITHSETAATASTPFEFDEDIDNGAKGSNYMRLRYTVSSGGSGHIVIENIKITPWLLYTTKEATLDTRGSGALTYTNPDLIDNTGSTVTYTIEDYDGIPEEKIAIAADGTVTVADRYQTGDITIQAKWSEVTTTYTLHVVGKEDANAHFVNAEENKTLLDIMFNNPVVKETGSGDATYASDNTDVATVDGANVTIKGVGDAVITATIAENDNFQGAVVSYTLHVAAPNFYITGTVVGEWNPAKQPVYGESYTIQNLKADQEYLLKITTDGTWGTAKGFNDLTASEIIAGVYDDGTNDHNVKFTLATAGNVTVTYDGEVFKLAGDFTPQTVEFGGSWTSDWADGKITADLSADKKSATATKTFTVDEDGNKNWYNFKPIINGSWLGCEAGATGVTRSSLTVSGFTTVDNNNHIYFQADEEGEYKFTWVFGTNTFVFTFAPSPYTAIDETGINAKAEKQIINGQLVIMKNGVRYNVLGQAL